MTKEFDFGSTTASQFEMHDPLLSLVNKEKIDTSNIYKLNRGRYVAWVLYDVANTFYASGILSFIAVTWILVRGQENGLSYSESTALYTLILSGASVFMAVLLPILGSLSDVTQQRKNYVTFFTIVCLISTYLFILLDSLWPVLIAFAVSMITYQWAQVFYDAMLPGIVPPGKEARLSSIAITIGYIGGAIITYYAFILNQSQDQPNANPNKLDEATGNLVPVTLGYSVDMAIAVIIGFTLLSIPIFFIKETNWDEVNAMVFLNDLDEWERIYHEFQAVTSEDRHVIGSTIRETLRLAKESMVELWHTFKDIKKNNQGMFFYIIAYFIIADMANLMAVINIVILREGIGLNDDQIFPLIATSGLSLLIITPILGVVCDKKGAKAGFFWVAVFWFITLSIMIFEDILLPKSTIYIAAAAFGPALSGVWVCQRQMVLELVPNDDEIGRYFGLTKFSGKLSSAIGPLLFGGILLSVEEFYKDTSTNYVPIAYKLSLVVFGLVLGIGFYILDKFVPNKSDEFKRRRARITQALADPSEQAFLETSQSDSDQ